LALIASPPEPVPPPPPEGLDATGAALWRNIVATWEWHDDPVIYRVVEEACYALQRAARCRVLIDEARRSDPDQSRVALAPADQRGNCCQGAGLSLAGQIGHGS
jgi:hypothetical protein